MKYLLKYKYGTSRGIDTYGYNTASLYVNGTKAASTCGGGYNMGGTVLGDWLEKEFQDKLKKLSRYVHCTYQRGKPWQANELTRREKQLYGMAAIRDEKGKLVKISLNGACGIESMRKIMNRLGITYTRMDKDTYLVETE